jgi:two-component system NarL family sensor kinase
VPYRLPDEMANTLLQITREALSNVVKHAAATQARVRLAYGARGVTLTVADDGRGFDPEEVWGAEHRGLRNLRTRTAEAGAC